MELALNVMKNVDLKFAVFFCVLIGLLNGCDESTPESGNKLTKQAEMIPGCVNNNLSKSGAKDITLKAFYPLTNETQYYFIFEIDHDQNPKTDAQRYRAGLLSEEVIKDIQSNNFKPNTNLPPRYASSNKYDDAIVSRILSGDDVKYDQALGFGYSNRLALHNQRSVVLTSELYLVEFLNAGFRGDDLTKRVGAARDAIGSLGSSIEKCLQ
jgi:hypothetical protein